MASDSVDLLLSDLGDGSDFGGLLQTLLPDPYGLYASVRPSTPLRLDDLNAVVLARFADAEAVLSDPSYRLIHPRDERIDPLALDDEDPVARVLRDEIEPCVLFMPPERHAVVRRHLQKTLKEDSPQRRHELAREMAGAVLDALEGEAIDAVSDLAVPVSTFAAAHSFGMPQEDWPLLLDWAGPVGRWLEMFVSPEQMARSAEAILAARAYFDGAIAERSAGAGEGDLLVGLAKREGEGLGREEALSGCLHIMAANATTTVGALTNALVALAGHPDQWALLVADPSLADAAFEEALRWDPPTQAILRIASEAGEVGGAPVREGDLMVAIVAAANRDPDRYEDPDRFDIRRERRRHLGFGAGSHFCSGAHFGRATAIGVIEAVAERVEGMSVDRGLLEWSDTLAQRQLDFAPLAIRRKGG
jgi:cytochrome P450